jgi:hypothetical protein
MVSSAFVYKKKIFAFNQNVNTFRFYGCIVSCDGFKYWVRRLDIEGSRVDANF